MFWTAAEDAKVWQVVLRGVAIRRATYRVNGESCVGPGLAFPYLPITYGRYWTGGSKAWCSRDALIELSHLKV